MEQLIQQVYSCMFDTNLSSSKPIAYIITPDFNSDHIQELAEELDKNSIPYSMQKETDTLGHPLNKRFFVVVDNIKGTVVLGPEFSSLVMFIVGYPRKGENKKNYYCKRTADVVERYRQFRKLPELEKINYSTCSIKTKSQLKSISSIHRSKQSSMLLHNRSQSVNSKLQNQPSKLRSLTQSNEESKVFLMKSKIPAQKDKYLIQYNKVVSKIAVSNPDKYKIVQTYPELKSCLEMCFNSSNFLLVNQEDMSIQYIDDNKNLRVLVYVSVRKKQISNQQQKLNHERIKYVNSLEQILTQIGAIKKESMQIERSKIRMRKLQMPGKRQDQKSKGVAWAHKNQQFKLEPFQSQKIGHSEYYTKNYPHSEKQISKIKDNQIAKTIFSKTQPEENRNYFVNNIRQEKALEEIEKQYYHMNAPKLVQQKQVSDAQLNKTKRQRIASVFSHENVINLKIQHKKSGEIISNNENKSRVSILLSQPQYESKEGVLVNNLEVLKPRKIIKKIKRVKSENPNINTKKMNSSQENIQKPPLIKQLTIQRKFILPEEYCAPVSPPSSSLTSFHKIQSNPKTETKVERRVVRSYSQQPEIKYFQHQQPQQCIILKKYRLNNINQRSQINFYNNQYLSSDKKSQFFLSTAGTEEDFAFVKSNLSPSDYGFQRQRQSQIQIQRKDQKIRVQKSQILTNKFCQNNVPVFNNLGVNPPDSQHKNSSQKLSSDREIKISSNQINSKFQYHKNQKIPSSSVFSIKKMTPTCILWKDFNFDIEEGVNKINKTLDSVNIKQQSFYGVSEFQKIFQSLYSDYRFILMIDQTDLTRLLSSVHNFLTMKGERTKDDFRNKILAIYLFPKNENLLNKTSNLTNSVLKPCQYSSSFNINELIKVVQPNDYYESSKFIAKQVCNLICARTQNQQSNLF